MNSHRSFVLTLLLSGLLASAACAQALTASSVAKPDDWTAVRAGVPKGKVESFTIDDKQYSRKRKITVYTPADYDAKASAPYRLVISFDGEDYINDMPSPVILDNLIAAGKIYPAIQVMVDNSDDRLGDLANHQKFADFVANEVLPWAQKNYRVTKEADKTVLLGYSAGGLASTYVAFRYPTLFGNVLSQSGAFWRGNEGASSPSQWLTDQFQNSPKMNVRFYLEVGGAETMKNASGWSMVETSRHLRDVLKAKGNEVVYLEAPNAGHEPGHWRAQLAGGLIYLIGKKP